MSPNEAISAARRFGQANGACRVAIVAVNRDGSYSVTTWGEKMADCRALAAWADANGAEDAAVAMHYAVTP